MQLAGKHVLHAAPPKVWATLMNKDTLARVVPGISHLEETGDHTYKSTLDIKLGPVNGSFTGNLQLDDLQEPSSFTLKGQQNSKIGNANAAIKINLLPVGTNDTEIAFEGDVKLSGMLASLGQRVMGGVSNTLSKQFFANLEKELNNTTA
ncbi:MULTISPECIES: CoxG family protein [Niastella]|uniref:Carbon monoxide dehydrogenase subunit G n=1 Tax=Niastella soli TaxID=2821487 RepID=A0ABS3Z216_9BACT|nr:carbon monoxide dehydrogenase subunit G [Niastella soli]MBO9203725.1 carbon monoxide dehydrogenase subunit G [Niastella soli]